MFIKLKKGASILEAILASALLAMTALIFSQTHLINFSIIRESSQLLKVSVLMSDFSDQVRGRSFRLISDERNVMKNKYLALNYMFSNVDCQTPPAYITRCLNSLDLVSPLCTVDDMIKFDVLNYSCGVSSISGNFITQSDLCFGSTTHVCIWTAIDGKNRTQFDCRNDLNKCLLMEVKF